MTPRKHFSRSGWLSLMALLALVPAFATAGGDPDNGKAQAVACGACHGQDGATGLDGTYPNLAGQSERYLLRQLKMIQSGDRNIALMAGQLNGKSEQQLADIAAYYASLPAKVGQADGSDEKLALGERLYRGGSLEKGVAPCTACHLPNGGGVDAAGFPHIAGQPSAYTINQLKAYREAQRATDEDYGGMMRGVASRLTDTEIEAVAEYIRGLH